ncbi:MAG: hypothetical protein OQK04_03560 [Kangiellaceae bacterium]|nr:hypothetical protein [Kangiellaceae bacterium]MCW8997770.1 hypothetical protein [Kangiellaceae bacterium]
MQSFDLYPQAWAVYIGLGLVLLFLLDLKLRKSNFVVRVAVLSLIAVGAFTPDTVRDADSLAPLVLTSVLNAEVDGISAIYQGLLKLVIIWGILVASILSIRHFVLAKKDPDGKNAGITASSDHSDKLEPKV